MSNEVKKDYTDKELDRMSNAELAALGTELDDVELVEYQDRWPVEGTRAEKRAEKARIANEKAATKAAAALSRKLSRN